MLGKLLKYDLRANFKYWWILAIITLGAAILEGIGGCINNDPALYQNGLLSFFATVAYLIWIFCQTAFILMSFVIPLIHFYRNFFTDEGYLTFTLPVKRSQLLNSKLISFILVILSSAVIELICQILINVIGAIPRLSDQAYIDSQMAILETLIKSTGLDDIAYYIMLIAMAAIAIIILMLCAYFCITFGAVIAKKHKLLSVLGIVYLASTILSSVLTIALVLFSMGIYGIQVLIAPHLAIWVLVAFLALVCLICVSICIFIYSTMLYLLGRRLNLA